jgi:hypothetical protein
MEINNTAVINFSDINPTIQGHHHGEMHKHGLCHCICSFSKYYLYESYMAMVYERIRIDQTNSTRFWVLNPQLFIPI